MKKLYFLLLSFIVLASGCNGYLDIKPNGRTIPNTTDEFASILHSRLNEIDYGADEPLLGNSSSILDLECFADNLDASLTDYNAGRTLPIYAGSQINTQQTRYSDLYARIKDCNIVIDNLPDDGTEMNKNVLGTAFAIRGVAYYNLLREFCGPFVSNDQPGLPLVESFDMEDRPLRSSYQRTVALIEHDLKKALSYEVKDDLFRFTDDVVKAYLARLYFWTRDWDKAIEYAGGLLDAYPLVIGADYWSMIQAVHEKKGNVLLRSYLFSDQSADITFRNNLTELEARPVSKEFTELFPEKENDIRYAFFFSRKRLNTKNLMACIRTDEMCLMLAEAYAHKQDTERSLHYLNLIRSRRISPYVALTSATLPMVNPHSLITKDAEGKPLTPLMQAVLNERRKEFYAEGDRFFELKRNGCPEFWIGYNGFKYVMFNWLYTFPLPRVDVDLTGGLEQNPGYQR